jgi:Pyridine nucleotide-disulphide oxidoreductase, dimerisation domain
MQGNAGASFYGRDSSPGIARLVVDDDRGVAVGATFTGPEVAEFLHAATIAVVAEVPLERLFHAVPAFPTRSEVWLYLLEELGLAGPRRPSPGSGRATAALAFGASTASFGSDGAAMCGVSAREAADRSAHEPVFSGPPPRRRVRSPNPVHANLLTP